MAAVVDPRMLFVIEIALSMLSQWYVTWETYKDHGSAVIRRIALNAKCRGLVYHDRALAKAVEVIRV